MKQESKASKRIRRQKTLAKKRRKQMAASGASLPDETRPGMDRHLKILFGGLGLFGVIVLVWVLATL